MILGDFVEIFHFTNTLRTTRVKNLREPKTYSMSSGKGSHPPRMEIQNGNTGCAHSLRSLRLPSVALLEFTPYLIRGRNDNIGTQRECSI